MCAYEHDVNIWMTELLRQFIDLVRFRCTITHQKKFIGLDIESNRSFHTCYISIYALYCWPTYSAAVIIAYSFIND